MRITSIGHAGFLIETTGGRILCDPWATPTFFGSWHPFPRVDTVDPTTFDDIDYLYVSHVHRDHLDPDLLAEKVAPTATVLLPDFGVDTLRRSLEGLGFERFVETRNGQVVELPGDLRIAISSLAAPHVGPMGDSMLVVADPSAVVLNQNDAHPADLDVVAPFGPVDVHLLQYSGAIWYPMVYDIPADEEARLIDAKRRRQTERAFSYIDMIEARLAVPSAGPPCFLDDETFHLNDFTGCEADATPTIFPDARSFVREMETAGRDNHRLLIPGSELEVGAGTSDGRVTHPVGDEEVEAIFDDKREYLRRYQADTAETRSAIRASWPTDTTDLFAALAEWMDPLLSSAPLTRAGVGGAVELSDGQGFRAVIDMAEGRVRRPEPDERTPFRFTADRRLLESSIRRRVEDWCNELFLSCRFEAHRSGAYNEYVYTFFKSLSPERMAYTERYYADQLADAETEWITCDGWVVEARCPHQRARLDRVGSVEGEVLTCGLHGWQFDLNTGACLTSEGAVLRVRGRVEHPED